MLILIIFAVIVGYVIFVLFERELNVYNGYSDLSWLKLAIKVIYRLLRYRKQGVLRLDNSLVYVAGGACVNANCSLVLSPTNHKLTVNKIRIDNGNLVRYKSLCGYDSHDNDIPVCYGETLFLKALIAVITSPKLCLSPLGLIHIGQTIKQHAPLHEYARNDLSIEIVVKEYRQMDRGVEVDIALRILADRSVCIWEGLMTLLSRGKQT